VISQDYIRTARAKGQGERTVVYKHAFRNMMVPLLTIIGLFVAVALTGTVQPGGRHAVRGRRPPDHLPVGSERSRDGHQPTGRIA
jgi:peptide/nickel transport system permease protein